MENATETNLQFASYPGVILHPDPLNRSRFRGPMLARLKSRCQFTSYLRNVYLLEWLVLGPYRVEAFSNKTNTIDCRPFRA